MKTTKAQGRGPKTVPAPAALCAARRSGANAGEQIAYGGMVAGAEVLTEKMFDGLAGIYGKGAADEVVDQVIGKLAKTTAGKNALRILASMSGEALEEVVSGIVDPALESIYNGKNVRGNYSADTAADVLHDAIIGGLLGLFGGMGRAGQSAVNAAVAPDVICTPMLSKIYKETDIAQTKEKAYNADEQLDINGNPIYITSRERANIQPEDLTKQRAKRKKADAQYGLTKEDSFRIKAYVDGLAYAINKKILTGKISDSDRRYIAAVAEALNKFPVFEGRTYRNLSFESKEVRDAFLAKYAEGSDVVSEGFMSSSKLPNGYPLLGDYVIHMVIDGSTGHDIADTYGLVRQQEVIFSPGTYVRVMSVTIANDGHPLIFVKEVAAYGQRVDPANAESERSAQEDHKGGFVVGGNTKVVHGVYGAAQHRIGGNVLLPEWGESNQRLGMNGKAGQIDLSAPSTAYADALRKLMAEGKVLSPEQRAILEEWNKRFPEMRMDDDEFLKR